MKAKDWARAAVSEPGWWQPGPDFMIDFDLLRGHVADAIAAAIAAERQACAKTAYQYGCADARDAILRRSKERDE